MVPYRRIEEINDLVKRLRECAESGAPPHEYDVISLLDEAADALEFLQELRK